MPLGPACRAVPPFQEEGDLCRDLHTAGPRTPCPRRYHLPVVVRIRLLGRPSIEGDGVGARLDGMKPWALLASVLLAERPPSRRELAERIWSGTADPLAAVRWGLLQVRRALEPAATIVDRDGYLVIESDQPIVVDVRQLLEAKMEVDSVEEIVRGELLEDFHFPDAPALEQWLTLERARCASASAETLRWAANLLARRDPVRALGLLGRVTRLDPFDDVAHELTVGTLVGQGDRRGAERYLASLDAQYRAELGIGAPSTVRRALEGTTGRVGGVGHRVSPAVAVTSLREQAEARLAVGDYEGAESYARQAAAEAAVAGDLRLEASVLVSLAETLVHAVRGRHREAVGFLDRALARAVEAGDDALAAAAERELGWVAFLAGDYGAAETILYRAIARSEPIGDRSGTGRARTVLGACQSDRTRYEDAATTLQAAIDELEGAADRWLPFAISFLARVRLRTGQPDEARRLGDIATSTARAVGWHSLLPWTLVVAGEGRLMMGDLDGATRTLEEALAHASIIGDPCWDAFSLRGVGLLREQQGERAEAIRSLQAAVDASRRLPNVYAWCQALCLTDLARLDASIGADPIEEGLRLTGRAPMPDLFDRLSVLLEARTPRPRGGVAAGPPATSAHPTVPQPSGQPSA